MSRHPPLGIASTSSTCCNPTVEALTLEEKVHLYREMVRIRRFSHRAILNYQRGAIGGFLIHSDGQEGIPVATKSLLGPNDHWLCNHRSLPYALASGMTMNECMAELWGKSTGCSQGKGGMFGFFAPDKNFHGGYSVAGAQTPIAAGLAFALKHQGVPAAVICALGDGALNQGCVHESFNLASLFDLPVVYLIENNQFSMGTSVPRHSPFQECLARRAESYDMDWVLIEDGSNLELIRQGLFPALQRARHERRPTIVEISTYRFHGFTIADAEQLNYRTRDDVEFHKAHHDPIKNWHTVLEQEGLLSPDQAKLIEKEAKTEAKAATDFATSSSAPSLEDLTRNVYWSADHQTDLHGRLFFND